MGSHIKSLKKIIEDLEANDPFKDPVNDGTEDWGDNQKIQTHSQEGYWLNFPSTASVSIQGNSFKDEYVSGTSVA